MAKKEKKPKEKIEKVEEIKSVDKELPKSKIKRVILKSKEIFLKIKNYLLIVFLIIFIGFGVTIENRKLTNSQEGIHSPERSEETKNIEYEKKEHKPPETISTSKNIEDYEVIEFQERGSLFITVYYDEESNLNEAWTVFDRWAREDGWTVSDKIFQEGMRAFKYSKNNKVLPLTLILREKEPNGIKVSVQYPRY